MTALDARYQDALLGAIFKYGAPSGGTLHHDAQAGSIFVEVADADCYCTPGWEDAWSGLPIEWVGEDGETLGGRWVECDWTGDVELDVATWYRIVEAEIRQRRLPL